ncbi:MAG TPA: NAD(P)/FAD-dependent oxidoreductase [Intrasporangium sp.]|uniref:NAD(P)/FAD-dependent oxidoreductase n=1 Tax=Intrasporangium sp. TaxID=1925024 RepID=UPI002D7A0E98|nr:NAD(P)/FAD-dependent oxidoreductase [Intrasporangium sp.]HET7398560.1 NAD(P)/FAD-dependent oxidoreductase [Intrasporangium sp.]
MKDVVIVGGGLAGLTAGWSLRHQDTLLLESDNRIGGRIRSERRGPYWLNWGGHIFAGPGSSTDTLLRKAGVDAVGVPGSLTSMFMNGKFLVNGRVETYPFRIPMSPVARVALIRTGIKVGASVIRYAGVVRQRQGEHGAVRQQRIYDFENERTFKDFIGELPEDADALFRTTVTRSAGETDEISAGAGIGYFSLVWNVGQGLSRGIVGGPSTLTEALAAAQGDRLQLGAEVQEVVHRRDSVVVRYRQDGTDREVEARTVVLATPATVAHRVAVDLPAEVREALSKVRYGPHVSAAFLTNETSARRWDPVYAISAPKRSFAIALNQASIVRGSERERQVGGSIMTFSPGNLGRNLLDKSDSEVIETHLRDLEEVLGAGFSDSVVEAGVSRWKDGSPYSFPGRAKLQPTLMRRGGRVLLAGDYLGTLYTETAIQTGFAAAQEAASLLATDHQRARHLGPLPRVEPEPNHSPLTKGHASWQQR